MECWVNVLPHHRLGVPWRDKRLALQAASRWQAEVMDHPGRLPLLYRLHIRTKDNGPYVTHPLP